MMPTRLYVLNVLKALAAHPLNTAADGSTTGFKALAHITAGIDDIEMNHTFNNGIGIMVVDATSAAAVSQTLRDLGENVFEIDAIAPQGTCAAVVHG